jgi:hypothetical protein
MYGNRYLFRIRQTENYNKTAEFYVLLVTISTEHLAVRYFDVEKFFMARPLQRFYTYSKRKGKKGKKNGKKGKVFPALFYLSMKH